MEQPAAHEHENSKVSLLFTREGWIYFVVLVFISSGALLRNINLLILLTGLMIAPLLVGWRLSVVMLRRMSTQRSVPKILFARRPAEINWEVRNERKSTGSWQLVLRDQCQRNMEGERWLKPESVRILFQVVRPGESIYQSYKISIERRGAYRFGPATLATRFPFGLIQTSLSIRQLDMVYVAPPIGKLTTSWDRRLLSTASGQSSVKRRRGLQDDEFFALRGWRSGDSIKQIHWRTTAKYSRPVVKQFDTRTDKDFVLVLDLFESNPSKTESPNPLIEQVLSFASTVFTRLQGNLHGQIAIAICGEETQIHCDQVYSRVAPEVLTSLAMAQGTRRPQVARAILEAGRSASEGTPLYVFSSRAFPADLPQDLSEEDLIRFRKIEPWIRWVDAASDEFKSIFQMDDDVSPSRSGGKPTADLNLAKGT